MAILTSTVANAAELGASLRANSAATPVFLRVKNMRLHLYTFTLFALVGHTVQAAKPVLRRINPPVNRTPTGISPRRRCIFTATPGMSVRAA